MKAIQILFLLLISLSLCGCIFNKEEERLDPKKLVCYLAVVNGDTVSLSVDTTGKRVNGLLRLSYGGIRKFNGQFKGRIIGDTLKGHYDFKLNKIDKWYRNPVAFLKKGDQLVMGVGTTVMIWGSGHFDPKVPINFEKGRFTLSKTNCRL